MDADVHIEIGMRVMAVYSMYLCPFFIIGLHIVVGSVDIQIEFMILGSNVSHFNGKYIHNFATRLLRDGVLFSLSPPLSRYYSFPFVVKIDSKYWELMLFVHFVYHYGIFQK